MIHRIFFLMQICFMSALVAMGQSDTKTINSIKRDKSYIYEEATAKDADEAYQTASELLKQRIEEFVAEEKKLRTAENIIIRDMKSYTEQIQMQRGDLTRVFLYVKKKDILPAETNVSVMHNDNKVEETKKEKQDIDMEAKVEVVEVADVVADSGDESLKLPVAWQQSVIDRLLECRTIAEAKVMLSRQKAEFKVKRYGTFTTCSDKSACFWIASDEQGNLLTILGPGTEQRTNFRTLSKETVNISNNAMWFTLAK